MAWNPWAAHNVRLQQTHKGSCNVGHQQGIAQDPGLRHQIAMAHSARQDFYQQLPFLGLLKGQLLDGQGCVGFLEDSRLNVLGNESAIALYLGSQKIGQVLRCTIAKGVRESCSDGFELSRRLYRSVNEDARHPQATSGDRGLCRYSRLRITS